MATPHSCPVCGGSGTMPAYFYETFKNTTGTALIDYAVPCRSCMGAGIVWGPECQCQKGSTVMPGGVRVTYHVCPHENKPS